MPEGFYKSNQNYQLSLDKLMSDEKVSAKNKKAISDFVNHLKAEDVSAGRIKKYITLMHKIVGIVGRKNLSDYTKQDLEKVLAYVNGNGYSVHTKHDYKVGIKKFMKFFEGENYDAKKYSWITAAVKKNVEKKLIYDDLLTREQIEAMIKATDNPMYRCLIALHYESGMRPSEMLSLTINCVNFENGYSRISIRESKTMQRIIFVKDADAYIKQWLNAHPLKGDPTAPLFLSRYAVAAEKKFLLPESYNKALKLIALKASITKRVWAYLFRHSRITHMIEEGWNPMLIQKQVGQVDPSSLRVYEHLAEKQLEEGALKMWEKAKAEQQAAGKTTGIECNLCHTTNPLGNDFCLGCNRPITNAAIMAQEQRAAAIEDFMIGLIDVAKNDPHLTKAAREIALAKGLDTLLLKKQASHAVN